MGGPVNRDALRDEQCGGSVDNTMPIDTRTDADAGVFPCPPFEGSEKRIEIRFSGGGGGGESALASRRSLRNIPRRDLESMLAYAECEIISTLSGVHADAYLLSESTMFVEESAIVLKTCGTTKLLAAVPAIIALAKSVCDAVAVYVRYSRASYLFPEFQPDMHRNWADEVRALKAFFCRDFGCNGNAYEMGDSIVGLRWHIFTIAKEKMLASAPHMSGSLSAADTGIEPTVEICMTGMSKEVARSFFRDDPKGFTDAKLLSKSLGIPDLLPRGCSIDEYIFEPCGYSMNSLSDEGTKACMHVTPEDGYSFVSHEVSWTESLDLSALIRRTIEVFDPETMSLLITSKTMHGMSESVAWVSEVAAPYGRESSGVSFQQFPHGGFGLMTSLRKKNAGGIWTQKKQQQQMELVQEEPGTMEIAPCTHANRGDTGSCGIDRLESIASSLQPWNVKNNRNHDENDAERNWKPRALMTPTEVLGELSATRLENSGGDAIDTYAHFMIQNKGLEDTFYVTDLGVVRRRWEEWQECLPRVEAHYAVKCNPDNGILSLLASLGSGFDCASVSEFDAVLALGVDPSRIVYANPCKPPAHAKAAMAAGINLQTFDSVFELRKLAKYAPNASLLLRIRADDTSARCELGSKFGAEFENVQAILRKAVSLGSNVVGVSFHIGSGAGDPRAFPNAIAMARAVFDIAKAEGFGNMHVLDIGGGFSGGGIDSGLSLRDAAPIINCALDTYFPNSDGVKIIAEPGRYFAEAAATLYAKVFGRRDYRERQNADVVVGESGYDVQAHDATPRYAYYISDGVYGSMNCLFYDHAVLECRPLFTSEKSRVAHERGAATVFHKSTVFGPTCDGLDKVLENVMLPFLDDDWLAFPSMGAYTLSAASSFNGFDATVAPTFYVSSEHAALVSCDDDNSMNDSGNGSVNSIDDL